jgi:hypothetical protein
LSGKKCERRGKMGGRRGREEERKKKRGGGRWSGGERRDEYAGRKMEAPPYRPKVGWEGTRDQGLVTAFPLVGCSRLCFEDFQPLFRKSHINWIYLLAMSLVSFSTARPRNTHVYYAGRLPNDGRAWQDAELD